MSTIKDVSDLARMVGSANLRSTLEGQFVDLMPPPAQPAPAAQPAAQPTPPATPPGDSPLPVSLADELHEEPDPPGFIVLPSGPVSISRSARRIFEMVAPKLEMFLRGRRVMELQKDAQGWRLEIVSEHAFRSRVEQYARLLAWRKGNGGEEVLKLSYMSLDQAQALLATGERKLLPEVTGLAAAPVLTERGDGTLAVLPPGYDAASGMLVTGGQIPEPMSAEDAAPLLLETLAEFDFATPADQARALAALLSPTLLFGGLLRAHFPLFVVEADDSQAGKGYLLELAQAIHGESDSISFITQKNGGVGGFDESLSQAMLTGRPFIQLDNVRGKIASTFFEAVLTCPLGGTVPARVPHKGEIQVTPARFVFQLTSNGFETTRDLANRSCLVRIRKRRGHRYRTWPEGGLLEHVRAHQGRYLGAAQALAAAWHARGRPRTDDLRGEGRFRPWAQALDWIVQNLCGLPPLMDGHERAQERASSPTLTWLRQLVLAIEETGELEMELSASRLLEISRDHGLAVPGVTDEHDEKTQKQRVGIAMATLFKARDVAELDSFRVERTERLEGRGNEGGRYTIKLYSFFKL